MKDKKKLQTQPVRIDIEVIEKVREHVKITKQTIGGFFSIAAKKELDNKC